MRYALPDDEPITFAQARRTSHEIFTLWAVSLIISQALAMKQSADVVCCVNMACPMSD